MVEDIYELERHEVSRSVPVIGDFVLSSLVSVHLKLIFHYRIYVDWSKRHWHNLVRS